MPDPVPADPVPSADLSARVAKTATDYLQNVSFEGDRAGFALVRRLWGEGIVGKSTLFVLIAGALLTAFFITQPPSDATTLTPTLLVATILFVFGYSLAVAAASRLPLWGYVIAAAYLAFIGLLPFLSLPRILITLPLFWLLLNGWFVARATLNRSRYFWLLLLCLGAAYLIFPGLSLSQFFPGPWNLPARILLGLAFFALLANSLALPPPSKPLPRLALLFGATLALTTALVLIAVLTVPDAWVSSSLTTFEFALAFVSLLWLALGAGAFGGAVKAGEWVGARTRGLLTTRGRVLALLVFIALVTLGEYLITHSATLLLAGGMLLAIAIYFATYYHVWFGVVAVVLGLAAWLAGRLDAARASLLLGAWLGAFFALTVLFTAYLALSELERGAFTPLAFGVAVLLIGGLLWELAKSGADWSKSSPARLYGLLALLVLTLGISAALFGAGSVQVSLVSGLYSFYGILFIGIPFLALTLISRALAYQPADSLKLGALFALGWLGAVPLLLVNPNIGWEMLAMPVYWFVVLWFIAPRLVPLRRRLDAVVAGCALALGFVTMWMAPQPVYIPFVDALYELQKPLDQLFLTRPILQFEQLVFTLVALAVGSLCGLVASHATSIFAPLRSGTVH
jgi:hypothetical protein